MAIFITWIIFSFIVGMIGSNRKIGFLGALLISLLLSPLIGLIITLFSKDNQTDKLEKAMLHQHEQKQNDMNPISVSEASTQLDELEKVRSKKLITDDEYQGIRKRIMDRIQK